MGRARSKKHERTASSAAEGEETARLTTITTLSKAEAECIAAELDEFECELVEASRGWTVNVAADAELAPVLRALEACLRANSISAVSVRIDGREYVMEGAPL
jgi:hypothetical protein